MRARHMADARTELTFLIRHRQDITRRDGARQSRPPGHLVGSSARRIIPETFLSYNSYNSSIVYKTTALVDTHHLTLIHH